MFIISDDFYEIRSTPKKGRGVFAKKDIPPGLVIGDYIGRVIKPEDFDEARDGLYDCYYSDTVSILADPKKIGVHLINNSCTPNCDTFPYKGHTIFHTLRKIFKGEELTHPYQMNPADPISKSQWDICYCNSPFCRGTMYGSPSKIQQWDEFWEREQKDYMDKLPAPYGEDLPRLETYPETLEDNQIFDIYAAYGHPPAHCEDSALPEPHELRRRIRETGRAQYFKAFDYMVYGVSGPYLTGMKSAEFP